MAGVSYSPPSMPPQNALAQPGQVGVVTKPGGHSAPPRPSGEQGQVRPSGNFGQVQQRGPSQAFDSITPTAQKRMPTAPEGSPGTVQRPSGPQRTPMASNPSMSFSAAPPSRPLGLIAIVLVVDLGLAGAGAFMLAKGLAKPKPAEKTPDKKSEAAPPPTPPPADTAAVTATPAPTAQASAEAPAPAEAPPVAGTTAAAATPAAAATSSSAASAARTRGARSTTTAPSGAGPVTSPSGPVTSPSGGVPVTSVPTETQPQPKLSTEAEIGALVNRSKASFERCRADQPIAGSIDVAFHVNPDGSIANAAAVENTTGNAELAACLVRIIAGWRVSPFQGNPMSFVRPFTYP